MSWLNYRGLDKYKPSEIISELAKRKGVDESQLLKLNANENLFLPKNLMKKALIDALNTVDPRLYPNEGGQLEKELGTYLDISPESIIVGNGSDQLIELLINSLLKKGDEVVAVNPTFSIYRRSVKIKEATYKPIDLNPDFTLNPDRMLEAVTDQTKLLILCNPNNPTGNRLSEDSLKKIIEGFEGLVILDEAYIEYALSSLTRETETYSNLIVLRTFSKAFGLAGVRLGYAVTNHELAGILRSQYQMPYAVSLISRMIGIQMLKNKREIMNSVEEAIKIREWLFKELNKIPGVRAFESDTNFILFNTSMDVEELYQRLLGKGIIIRKFGKILEYDNCLRVTIAPKGYMDIFLKGLKEALEV